MLHRITLEQAAKLLTEYWSASPLVGVPTSLLTPDALADDAKLAGWVVTSEKTENWETRTDQDVLQDVERRMGPFVGRVVLVTEASFRPGVGAFILGADELPLVLAEHQDTYEPVFNGDVIFGLLDQRRIVCLHHGSYVISIHQRGPSP